MSIESYLPHFALGLKSQSVVILFAVRSPVGAGDKLRKGLPALREGNQAGLRFVDADRVIHPAIP